MPLSFASCEILSLARRGIAKPAAYGERRILVDETDTVLYRPRRHDDAVAGFTLLPEDAAPRFADPRTLWDAVERRGRSAGRNRVVGLALVLGLPREDEFTLTECLVLVRRFAELLHRGHLPVRADIHRVVDGDGTLRHRHAHLTVGLFSVEGSRIGRTLERRWLPVLRGRQVHALDWSAIWTRVQSEVFRERDLDLAVPPASGLAEPKVVGRPRRGTTAALAGRSRQEVRDDVRTERARRLTEPSEVLRILTRNRMIVSRAELLSFLAVSGDEPDVVAALAEAVLAHQDVVRLDPIGSEPADGPLFTCRDALERAAAVASNLAGITDVSVRVAPISAAVSAALREMVTTITQAPDPAHRLVVVWSDAWLRASLEGGVPWPRGCRHIAARHLSELDRRDAPVLRWSSTTTVLVLSADRLKDGEVEILVRQASLAGAALRLWLVPDGPVAPVERGIAPMLIEQVLGERLPQARGDAVSLQILTQRLSWHRDDRDGRGRPQDDAPAVLIRSVRFDRIAPDEGDGARADVTSVNDHAEAALTPRQAWADPPTSALVMVRRPSDWRWAGPLLRAHPHLDVRFDIAESDRGFVAAVTEMMRGGRDALWALVGTTEGAAGSGSGAVSDGTKPSRQIHDLAGNDPEPHEQAETDGLDLDTDLDAEMAAEQEFNDSGVQDADDDTIDDDREDDVDEDPRVASEVPAPEF